MIINGKKYLEHNTALTSGYVSVKLGMTKPEEYKGRFGKGYTVKSHNPESTRYCYITYYTEKE